jgi:hypothetical protein
VRGGEAGSANCRVSLSREELMAASMLSKVALGVSPSSKSVVKPPVGAPFTQPFLGSFDGYTLAWIQIGLPSRRAFCCEGVGPACCAVRLNRFCGGVWAMAGWLAPLRRLAGASALDCSRLL